MGAFGLSAVLSELLIPVVYFGLPALYRDYAFVEHDLQSAQHFHQSLCAVVVLSVGRLIWFLAVRRAGKRAPATRRFLLLVVLFQLTLTVFSISPVLVYWQEKDSFALLRQQKWGLQYLLLLSTLAVLSCSIQLAYFLRLNKSRARLADDSLLQDVLNEKVAVPTEEELEEEGGLSRRERWQQKWTRLVKQFQRRKTDPTFEALVRLYAHRDGAVEGLTIAYEQHPSEFEFYLPQMCSFLLLGAFMQSPQLGILLLEKCSTSHVFAHKMLWYLQSYCLDNKSFASDENSKRVNMLIEEVSDRGLDPARGTARQAANTMQQHRLQKQRAQQISRPSRHFGSSQESEALLSSTEEKYNTFADARMSLESGHSSRESEEEERNPFEQETMFLNALANLSSNLRSISINRRNDMLRAWLEDLQSQYLPSNALYIPVGNSRHTIKHIHVGESFTFSTRERVPFLLCAEVIDYESLDHLSKAAADKKNLFKFGSLFDHSQTSEGHHDMLTPRQRHISSPFTTHNGTPDDSTLGFWSESQPARIPRMRSLSHTISSSMAQSTEILNGFLDNLVRRASVGMTAGGQWVGEQDKNRVPQRPRRRTDDFEQKTEDAPPLSQPTMGRSQSHSATNSRSSSAISRLEIGAGASIEPFPKRATTETPHTFQSNNSSAHDSGNVWSQDMPQDSNDLTNDMTWAQVSDGDELSPRSSDSKASSPRGLARYDSTDRFLQSLSERDSKLAEDEDASSVFSPSMDTVRRKDQPPAVIFKERWAEKERRIQATSPFGGLPGWRLLPVIVKANDDLRQEQLASQLIRQFSKLFDEAKLSVFLRPYDVIATSATAGLVEAISDTISIDSLKRNDLEYTSLLDFFTRRFGPRGSSGFKRARANFVSSLAGYSIVCYLLQVKDRHNGNLLVDAEGHIIHIDFGFFLGNNPGNMDFEQAPFKLTTEFVELMGGPRSATFRRYRSLCLRAFLVARKYRHRLLLLVEMMIPGNEHLPCFGRDPIAAVEKLADRFRPDLDISACEDFVHDLIDASLDNWRTNWYDRYQRWCVGVF